MKYRNARVISPVEQHGFRRQARCGKSVGRIISKQTSHERPVGTTACSSGFAVVTVMAMSDSDGYSLGLRPTKKGLRKKKGRGCEPHRTGPAAESGGNRCQTSKDFWIVGTEALWLRVFLLLERIDQRDARKCKNRIENVSCRLP